MNIVLIEDDLLLARQFERTLGKAGYSVATASHAPAAIGLIDTTRPVAIVADVLLAGSTVFTLLHELQSHDDLASIPIVLVTNLADDLSLESLKPYGVRRLLDKATMHPDDVTAAVRSVTI